MKGDGTQEVVVAPFDRGPLLKKFRDSVAAKLGDDIGDFCAQEALYDDTLAVGNKEVRIYTVRGLSEREAKLPKPGGSKYAEAMQKVERLMVSRGVHPRNRSGKPEWEGEAAPPRESTLSERGDYGPRYRHLQEAMSRLPRKTEPAK